MFRWLMLLLNPLPLTTRLNFTGGWRVPVLSEILSSQPTLTNGGRDRSKIHRTIRILVRNRSLLAWRNGPMRGHYTVCGSIVLPIGVAECYTVSHAYLVCTCIFIGSIRWYESIRHEPAADCNVGLFDLNVLSPRSVIELSGSWAVTLGCEGLAIRKCVFGANKGGK